MKNLYTVIILTIVITLSACCRLTSCLVSSYYVLVAFNNYEPSEIDTVYLTRVGTGYEYADTTIVYQSATMAYPVEDTNARFYELSPIDDWQLRIPATNEIYRFDGYTFTEVKCGNTRCYKPAKELNSFNVNGARVDGNVYNIYR